MQTHAANLAIGKARGGMSFPDHLIIGVDGSEGSQRALDWATAQRPDQATLVHGFLPVYPLLAAALQVRAAHAHLLETTWSETARAKIPTVNTVLLDDDAASALVDIAEQRAADAIVVGHHGPMRWGGHHLGKTAGRLLHRSRTPVILTSISTEPVALAGTILVGLTQPADTKSPELTWAVEVAERKGLSVHLAPALGSSRRHHSTHQRGTTRVDRSTQEDMEALVDDLRRRRPALEITSVTGEGVPIEKLADLARASHASLMVVRSGQPGPIRGFGDSVQRQMPTVLPCPLVVVPEQRQTHD